MALKLNEISNMPQMDSTLTDWFSPLILVKLTTTIVDFEAVPTPIYINTQGIIQPLKEQEISMKLEEQRAWEWLQIHCLADVILVPESVGVIGDRLLIDSVKFKVMKRKNYKRNGYVEYHLVEDYDDAN